MYDRQFYRAADFSEFDDTVSQIHMFAEEGEDIMLLPLCYAPNLRRFQHRMGIMGVPAESVFDRIQNIRGDSPGIISFRDLPWPEDIEWSYTPMVVVGYQNGLRTAKVEFDEDGNMLWVNLYEPTASENGVKMQMKVRYVFDDRGFLSSALRFENGQPVCRDYFDRRGFMQIREDAVTGAVDVSEYEKDRFQKMHYNSLAELIHEELLEIKKEKLAAYDTIVMASNINHNLLVFKAFERRQVILSFYGNRYPLENTIMLRGDVAFATAVVTDTEETADKIREVTGDLGQRIYDISPFDTRLSLGKSQFTKMLKIFCPIDGLQEPIRERAIKQMFQLAGANQNVYITFVTRSNDSDAVSDLQRELQGILEPMGIRGLAIDGLEKATASEELFGMLKEKHSARIFVKNCMHETEIVRELRDSRIIVDIRDNPDQYIQIAGISTGLPQVNYRNTRYIRHQKNGYMIHNIADLTLAINYYLESLAHWNESLIYCIDLKSTFTGSVIVARYKEMISSRRSS